MQAPGRSGDDAMTAGKATKDSGEDRLIARHFRPLATHPGAFGLIDDAAAISVPADQELVLKIDPIIAGVHFFADDPPDAIARKALRVNLSDLAAKGARPLGFLLALAAPKEITNPWLEKFAAGLAGDAQAFGCPLLGGDTDRTPGPLTVAISIFGAVPRGTMLMRAGAKPGDRLVVTGTIGDAALGLILRRDPDAAHRWRLDATMREHLLHRYLTPEPRNALAEALRLHAHGGMDVSDGLAGDLAKMCRAAGIDAAIEVAHVPLSPAARAALAAEPRLVETILTGGDDYEVLASVPSEKLEALREAGQREGVAVSEIGRASAGSGEPRFFMSDGTELNFARPSFSHF
jgi:thiamine-monophosphate kinase